MYVYGYALMSISDRILSFISTCYKSQQAFADAVEATKSQVSTWVNTSDYKLKSDTLIKFSKAGLDVHWLLTGEGDMFANNELGDKFRKNNPDLAAISFFRLNDKPAAADDIRHNINAALTGLRDQLDFQVEKVRRDLISEIDKNLKPDNPT